MKIINISLMIISFLLSNNINATLLEEKNIEESKNVTNYSNKPFYFNFKTDKEIEKIESVSYFKKLCKNEDSDVSFLVSSNKYEYDQLLRNDSISTLVLNLVDVQFNLKKKNTITLLNDNVVFLNKELDLTKNQEIFDKLTKNGVFEREKGIKKAEFKIMHVDENKLYNEDDIRYKLIQFYDKENKIIEVEYTKKRFKITILFKEDIILKDKIKIKSNSTFYSLFATDYTFFIDEKCF